MIVIMRKVIVLAGICLSGSVLAQPLSWSQVFRPASDVPSLALQATYWDAQGQSHSIRLQRSTNRWIHRQTDGTVDIYAKSEGPRIHYRLVDRQQKRVIDAERTSLYKVGLFLDWQHLATGLSQPDTATQLTQVQGPPPSTVVPCQWVQAVLPQQKQPYQLCWSARYDSLIALRSQQADGRWIPLYTVTALQPVTAMAEPWPDVPVGYQYQNVDADLQAD